MGSTTRPPLALPGDDIMNGMTGAAGFVTGIGAEDIGAVLETGTGACGTCDGTMLATGMLGAADGARLMACMDGCCEEATGIGPLPAIVGNGAGICDVICMGADICIGIGE